MEKNNLSGILIGLCLGIIMLFGIGLWKMNILMQKNEKENQSLRVALADKMDEISTLKTDKAMLTGDLHAFASNTEEAISQIEKEHHKEEESITDVPEVPLDVDGSAQSWITELKNELQELSRQESELLDVLADEQESLDPLSDELAQLEKKYTSIVKTETVSKELKSTVDDLQIKIKDLEQNKYELQEKISVVHNKSEQLSTENKRLKDEVVALEKELSQGTTKSGKKISRKSEKRIAKLSKEIESYKEKVSSLENEINTKNKTLKAINADKDDLTKQIISLQGELVKARNADTDNARVKLMQDKITDLEKDKTNLQYALKDLQEKFDGMKVELDTVVKGREELASESLKMQERLGNIEEEKVTKSKIIERLEVELKKAKDENVDEGKLQRTLAKEKENYEKVNTLYIRLKDQLKEVAQILAKRDELITKRETQLYEVIREKDYLKKKVDYLEDFFEKFKKQQTVTFEKLNGMDGEIEEASREVDVVVTSSLLEE